MSQQVARVETLFLHERQKHYSVAVYRDGERVFHAILELKDTDAGPRPAKLRVQKGSDEDLRDPSEFVDIARRAERIRISEQTSPDGRAELRELLDGYQLNDKTKTVRTCRRCAGTGRYSPLTSDTAIEADGEHICFDCAKRELERELNYRGMRSGARERLEDLLREVQDLERIVNLLQGQLDPDLTKFDEISATVEDVDPVPTDSLDVHPNLKSLVTERFDTLLPVQSLAVQNGALDGEDQLVVSATATGKTLIGELAGVDRVLKGEGKMLFLVPLVALANQKHEDFEERYGDLVDVTIRVPRPVGDAGDGEATNNIFATCKIVDTIREVEP